MVGNGFGYGQASHMLAWVIKVANLQPSEAYCLMGTSARSGTARYNLSTPWTCILDPEPAHVLLRTGADMTDAAVLRCSNGAAICFSGAASVPGNAHADVNNENVHSVGKHISIRIFGSDGLLTYEGDDQRPTSGKLVVTRRDGDEW